MGRLFLLYLRVSENSVREMFMKKFDVNYRLVEDMYQDGYFPDFLVDKVKALAEDAIGERDW